MKGQTKGLELDLNCHHTHLKCCRNAVYPEFRAGIGKTVTFLEEIILIVS